MGTYTCSVATFLKVIFICIICITSSEFNSKFLCYATLYGTYIKSKLILCFQEEMDMKVLVFQNKKLAERLELRKKAEEELKKRIEQLESRQTTDDAVLCIVNRSVRESSDHK